MIPLTNFESFLDFYYYWLHTWQGDTLDQFWTFFGLILLLTTSRWYLWPILNLLGLILLLTAWQGDTFDQFWTFFGLILLLTTWQGDTFDQFWMFFELITFDYLARWYLWPNLNLFLDLHYSWLLGKSFKGYLTSVKTICWLH